MDTAFTLVRCDTLADLPAFIGHAHAVVAGGERFGWWVEDADRALRLAFVIRIDRGAFRVADDTLIDHGVFSDFAAAIRFGVVMSERQHHASRRGRDGQRSRCAS